jgi:hypothetical protein
MIRRRHGWFSSLWIIDRQVADMELSRPQPAWTTVCGPLTIVCRSQLARDVLADALAEAPTGAGWPIDLRLAANRADMNLELARFAASARRPYVHVVTGSFDYQPGVARVLGDTLLKSRPELCAVDCALRSGDAYFFRGRSVCARLGIDRGTGGQAGLSLSDPAIDALLLRRDIFKPAVDLLMRMPPDAGWFRIALRKLLYRWPAPQVYPVMFGATALASPLAGAADWQSQGLSLVDELLDDIEAETGGGVSWRASARNLLDLVNLLVCARSLSPAVQRFVIRRATALSGVSLDALFADGPGDKAAHMALQALLCDMLGIEGPDTLEQQLDDCEEFFRQQLEDFVNLTPDDELAACVRSVLAGSQAPSAAGDGRARMRALTLRLKRAEQQGRQYRAMAASARDQVQAERQKRRLMDARTENKLHADD